MIIDLSNPKNIELLQAELLKVFPSACGHLYSGKGITIHSKGVDLGYYPTAWADIGWGWMELSDYKEISHRKVRSCPLGGFFIQEENPIGD